MPVEHSPPRTDKQANVTAMTDEQMRQLEADLVSAQAELVRMRELGNSPRDTGFDDAGSSDVLFPTAISALSHRLKLSTFSREQPDLWFFQAEVALQNAGYKSSITKAHKIIESLDMEALATVRDLIVREPRPADLFELVKARLIATFGSSTEARLHQLIKGQVSTCGKPSLVLSRLRALDPECPQGIVRAIFLEQLPATCRAVLSVSDETDLDKLAKMADKFAEVSELGSVHIAAATNPKAVCNDSDIKIQLERLTTMFDKLSKDIASVKKQLCRSGSRGREGSQTKSRVQSHQKKSDSGSASLCWAHRKFGDEAKSCSKPCARWPSNDKAASEN